MGASNFSQKAIGKDLRDAYRRASDEATVEYGTDPYNGTISTTDGVVSLDAILAPFSAARREVIAEAGIIAQRHDPSFDGPAVNHKGAWERWVKVPGYYGGTETWLMPKDVRPAEREAVVAIANMNLSKWGPCGGYEVTGKLAAEAKSEAVALGRNVRGMRVFRFVGWVAE